MSQPEWKLISRLGKGVHRRLDETSDLAFAEIDGSGLVLSLNQCASRAWRLEKGNSLPNSLRIALSELQPGESAILPVTHGGTSLLGLRLKYSDGWILIGYTAVKDRPDSAESIFRSLIENMPVLVTLMRPDGTVVYTNAAAEAVTGYRPTELQGRRFWLDAVHPEDRWKLMGAMRRTIEGEGAVVALRVLSKRLGTRLMEMHLLPQSSGADHTLQCIVFDTTERSEVEEALFQSESLYRIFLEQSPIGMLHLDAAGTVTFENHQFRRIIGESVEDAWIGRTIDAIPGLDPRISPLIRKMLREGKPFHNEEVSYWAHERLQSLSLHGSPTFHPDGGIVGGVVMIEDRSEEKRRANEIKLNNRYREAESALRKAALAGLNEDDFLSQASEILGVASGADRILILLNNAARDCCTNRSGWSRKGIQMPESLVVLHEDNAVLAALEKDRRCMHVEARRASEEGAELLELTGATEAIWGPFLENGHLGGFLVVERTGATSDGAPILWQESERSLIEQTVRLFEALWSWILVGNRYRAITATIDDCLFYFTYDEDGNRRYLFLTPQIRELTGRSPDDLVSTGDHVVEWYDDVVHEIDRESVDAHDDTLRNGSESRITYRIRHLDGDVRWLQEHASPQHDSLGDVIVSGILRDVTEQKLAEAVLTESKQQAESANQMKTAFIATMSHEIRTPLGAVNGFAELLARELAEFEADAAVDLPTQVPEFVEAIRENSQKLLTLVNDLFDLSNLEVGTIKIRAMSLPLHDMVVRSTSKVATALSQQGIDLRLDFDAGDPIVSGDPQRIEQVLDIILSNAVKFTDEGSVTVRTSLVSTTEVSVEVIDTGVGMGADYLKRLFTPFLQEDSRLNRRFEGSGLGLALAQRLLHLMGGRIEVDSSKGEGSVFRIVLPLATGSSAR